MRKTGLVGDMVLVVVFVMVMEDKVLGILLRQGWDWRSSQTAVVCAAAPTSISERLVAMALYRVEPVSLCPDSTGSGVSRLVGWRGSVVISVPHPYHRRQ